MSDHAQISGSSRTVVDMYNYMPSFGFNMIAILAFCAVFVAHGVWLVKYPCTRWIQALLLAIEIAVYAVRLSSYMYSDQINLWLVQFILSMSAPMWLVIAMLLAIAKAYKQSPEGRAVLLNRPKLIPMLLVGYQAVVDLLLIISALFTGNNRLLPPGGPYAGDSGKQLLIAALVNQVIILTLIQALLTWTFLTLRLHVRRAPSTPSASSAPSRRFLALLFLTAGTTWVRSIFRLVETAQGWSGAGASAEAFFGLFEFGQMITAAGVWAVVPFARVCEGPQDDEHQAGGAIGENGRSKDVDVESISSGGHVEI